MPFITDKYSDSYKIKVLEGGSSSARFDAEAKEITLKGTVEVDLRCGGGNVVVNDDLICIYTGVRPTPAPWLGLQTDSIYINADGNLWLTTNGFDPGPPWPATSGHDIVISAPTRSGVDGGSVVILGWHPYFYGEDALTIETTGTDDGITLKSAAEVWMTTDTVSDPPVGGGVVLSTKGYDAGTGGTAVICQNESILLDGASPWDGVVIGGTCEAINFKFESDATRIVTVPLCEIKAIIDSGDTTWYNAGSPPEWSYGSLAGPPSTHLNRPFIFTNVGDWFFSFNLDPYLIGMGQYAAELDAVEITASTNNGGCVIEVEVFSVLAEGGTNDLILYGSGTTIEFPAGAGSDRSVLGAANLDLTLDDQSLYMMKISYVSGDNAFALHRIRLGFKSSSIRRLINVLA